MEKFHNKLAQLDQSNNTQPINLERLVKRFQTEKEMPWPHSINMDFGVPSSSYTKQCGALFLLLSGKLDFSRRVTVADTRGSS